MHRIDEGASCHVKRQDAVGVGIQTLDSAVFGVPES